MLTLSIACSRLVLLGEHHVNQCDLRKCGACRLTGRRDDYQCCVNIVLSPFKRICNCGGTVRVRIFVCCNERDHGQSLSQPHFVREDSSAELGWRLYFSISGDLIHKPEQGINISVYGQHAIDLRFSASFLILYPHISMRAAVAPSSFASPKECQRLLLVSMLELILETSFQR